MKKLFKLMALASAVFLLGACAEETVLTPQQAKDASPENNAIAFGTYMGRTVQTRAGATGNITTEILKGFDAKGANYDAANAKKFGFGVFAYYTGTKNYGDYLRYNTSGVADKEANFMFNQLVWFDNTKTTDYVTSWSYSPIKYWPNEVKSASGEKEVDNQNNNSSNDPATTELENGGNVSFFAYAPYVDFGTTAPQGLGAPNGTNSGIVAINKQTTLAAANAVANDPIITYKLPDGTIDKTAVDLLWGTAGKNGMGVTGAANTGVQGDGNAGNDFKTKTGTVPDQTFTFNGYKESILGSYWTNADLSSTTGGTIEFAFKHALAKIGGSYTGEGEGDDEDATTPTHGLMVVLDLDNLKGAEQGGQLEPYLGFPLLGSSDAAKTKYNTKVTINELVIKCVKELKKGKDPNDLDFDYNDASWTTNIKNKGDLNLATGQWTNVTQDGTTTYVQTTLPSGANVGSDSDPLDAAKDAVLSEELAEPNGYNETKKAGFETLPIGVTTVVKNVYETETNPLVFIPGTRPIIEFTITYTVRTYDPNLTKEYTEVKQKIKKRLYITQAIELNKQYNILMHLGLTSVKFDATVSNWDVADLNQGEDGDGNPNVIPTTTEDLEHIWLPINVGDAEDFTATVAANTANATDANGKTVASVDGSAKTITLGSTPGKDALASDWAGYYIIADVTNPKATFDNEERNVELSHVAITATDADGNPVDWVKGYFTENTGKDPKDFNLQIVAKKNTLPTDRTATVYITYDNKSITYDLTQKGVVIEASDLSLALKNNNAAYTDNLKSGVGEYSTVLTYKYSESDTSGAATGSKSGAQTTTENYTIAETTTTGVKVSGTTFTTAPNKSLDTRSVTITATYGATKEFEFTQDAATVDFLYLKAQDGTTTVNVGALTDDNEEVTLNVFADMTVTNLSATGVAAAKQYKNVDVTEGAAKSATLNKTEDWLAQKSGDNNKNVVVVNKNNTPINRNDNVTVTYGTLTSLGDATSNPVTINQAYGALAVTPSAATSIAVNGNVIVTAKANGVDYNLGSSTLSGSNHLKVYKENGTTEAESSAFTYTYDSGHKVTFNTAGKYYIGVKVGNAPEAKTALITVTAAP